MKSVRIEAHEDPVLVKTNARVSEALLSVRENLLMACGGKGLCATCHVYVVEGADCLSPVTPREKMSLAMLCDSQPNSRLACQTKVLREGARVALPRGRFIDGTKDLEWFIGRRADANILHPVHGGVLIAAGKIITRSRIAELSFVDVDVAAMRTHSLSLRAAESALPTLVK
jgi:ferredoxin